MKQARLFPVGPPDGEPDVHAPPASHERLRTSEQIEIFPAPPPTEAELVDARIAAGRAEYYTRQARPKRDESARSRRKRDVRASTLSVKRMTKREIALGRLLHPELDAEEAAAMPKPKTRADCAGVPRPCPFVTCRHHLYLDVSARTGAIKMNFPDLEVWELPADASCALDVAERQGVTLEGVGAIMNLTRERIRQVEVKAIAKAKAADQMGALREFYGDAVPSAGRGRLDIDAKRRLPMLAERDEDEDERGGPQEPDADRDFDAQEFASVALDAE